MTQEEMVHLLRSTSWLDDRNREKQAAFILERYDVILKGPGPTEPPPQPEPVEEVTQPRARVKK